MLPIRRILLVASLVSVVMFLLSSALWLRSGFADDAYTWFKAPVTRRAVLTNGQVLVLTVRDPSGLGYFVPGFQSGPPSPQTLGTPLYAPAWSIAGIQLTHADRNLSLLRIPLHTPIITFLSLAALFFLARRFLPARPPTAPQHA